MSSAPASVFAVEPVKNLPVEELKLMHENELQQEFLSACRSYIEYRALKNAPGMGSASTYVNRLSLVARAKNGDVLPSWINPVLMAMYQNNLAGCTIPVK